VLSSSGSIEAVSHSHIQDCEGLQTMGTDWLFGRFSPLVCSFLLTSVCMEFAAILMGAGATRSSPLSYLHLTFNAQDPG